MASPFTHGANVVLRFCDGAQFDRTIAKVLPGGEFKLVGGDHDLWSPRYAEGKWSASRTGRDGTAVPEGS